MIFCTQPRKLCDLQDAPETAAKHDAWEMVRDLHMHVGVKDLKKESTCNKNTVVGKCTDKLLTISEQSRTLQLGSFKRCSCQPF